MQPVSYKNVTILDGFWGQKQNLNSQVTLQAVYDRFLETGRVGAFACRWTPESTDIPKPHVFWDSDVAKWMEGASYVLGKEHRPDLEDKIEKIIDNIQANQWEDGYINSCFTAVNPQGRFTERDKHELYCCGHLIEAAIAYYEATGKDRFLKIMCRYADLVDRIFRQEDSAVFATSGHEEIELALFKLWKCTGNLKYKELAEYFLNRRACNDKDHPVFGSATQFYSQDVPIREVRTAQGHSVRAGYLYTAMADLVLAEHDAAVWESCKALFDDIVHHKMYITGGVGSTRFGEAFTIPYDLPSDSAYTETCASVAIILFCHRLLQIELNRDYADIIERELYNGMLSGLSLDGRSFFYENPLEINLKERHRLTATKDEEHWPITQRVEVFGCSCCPPNLNRLLAGLGDYIFGYDNLSIAVHQYTNSYVQQDGMRLEVETEYPYSGKVRIRHSGVKTVKLRIPGWCQAFSLNVPYRMENGYAIVEDPCEGDIELDLQMTPVAVFGNPHVRHISGLTAVQYGPMVYCSESQDNQQVPSFEYRIHLPLNAMVEMNDSLGLPGLCVKAGLKEAGPDLYSQILPRETETVLHMIPYYAFANRGEDNMAVWHRY